MRTIATRLLLFLAFPAGLAAQPGIVTGEGWEAFPWIEYKGGHAQHSRVGWGLLLLTDSTLAFHECYLEQCPPQRGGRQRWKPTAIFSIRLRSITDVQSATRVKPASASARFMIGMLATDKNENLLAVTFETASSAEAPVFALGDGQASALDAKIRFRLKRIRGDSTQPPPIPPGAG